MNVTQATEIQNNKYNLPKTLDFRVKYKTEKCRYWEQQRFCPFGQMCAFVHDEFQMRFKGQIHVHYKTKLCLNFTKYGYCKYGDRCLFLHHIREDDRDRTRSNSPNQANPLLKVNNKHQQNLKLLAQFGFGVFQAHMNRPHSKIVSPTFYDECNLTSISTQPQILNGDGFEENYYYDTYEIGQQLINEHKKMRMYSL